MIRYTLLCENGHQFESWFPSGAAYDEQAERGLVTCPLCESKTIAKAPMAPALGRSDRGGLPVPAALEPSVPAHAQAEQSMRAMLRALRDRITRDSDHVGRDFASEARAIHYGEKPQRSIHGETSMAEARALIDEGIEVAPLPPAPDDLN